ncbi:MAG: hypothetical protein GX032_01810 [Tenericutes bacterium]|nr:hypothetical protein [Mycoplasmatota bacterium]
MKINKKISYILSGILALSGVNIPSSIAESNTKEINQIDEKYVVASYPNVLNLSSDKIDRLTEGSFNPTIDKLEGILWICLKTNDKKTLLLADYHQIFYDSTEGPLVQGVNNDSLENNEKYFLDKKQTLEDMSRYLSLTKFQDYILVNGYVILDLFNPRNLIGIYDNEKFYHNRNFFDKNEEIELVFFTGDINELANLISIDLSKYNLPERIKKNMEDGSTKISLKDVYDLYMAIVPYEYLPTLTQRKFNINPTVPIFKDEILEKNINEKIEELGYNILPTKSGETNFLFYYLDFKTLYYLDFYTREKIAKYGNTDFNKEYLKKLDVSDDFYKEDSNGIFNYLKIISNDFAFFVDEYLPGLDYLFTLSFTYGDFVDFYQKIPLDQQIDYSFYDFSKSPIIDQYEELPKPASCIPYIDYENNTLYAIPKTGRDNEIIKQLVIKNKENS